MTAVLSSAFDLGFINCDSTNSFTEIERKIEVKFFEASIPSGPTCWTKKPSEIPLFCPGACVEIGSTCMMLTLFMLLVFVVYPNSSQFQAVPVAF